MFDYYVVHFFHDNKWHTMESKSFVGCFNSYRLAEHSELWGIKQSGQELLGSRTNFEVTL
jgi:hypothetical protein